MFMTVLFMVLQLQTTNLNNHNNINACENAAIKFETEYNIKKHMLETITNVETGQWNEDLQRRVAWPWTVNARGKGYYFASKEEAVNHVKLLQKRGIKSIDVGCMQINLKYHPDAFETVEEALDPETNVEYAAKFLKRLYKSAGNDWMKASMMYHSKKPYRAKRYGKKIKTTYNRIKKNFDAKLYAALEL